jgi:hypothetical protein
MAVYNLAIGTQHYAIQIEISSELWYILNRCLSTSNMAI